MNTEGITHFSNKAKKLRKQLLKMLHEHKAGHIPSCYSMIDILTVLFFGNHIKYEFGSPNFKSRDKLIISKGHAAMALYPIFAEIGYFDEIELSRFTTKDGILGLYADFRVPGIEGISGSLGHGIGMAEGFILSDRIDAIQRNIFVVIGDGECYEGSIWESAMFAAHHKMHELKVILDKNELCILGRTNLLLSQGSLEEKWRSFGWHVISIDGHDYSEIENALLESKNYHHGPSIIIANTIKGKGISFMEGDHKWHNKVPSAEQFELAFKELS